MQYRHHDTNTTASKSTEGAATDIRNIIIKVSCVPLVAASHPAFHSTIACSSTLVYVSRRYPRFPLPLSPCCSHLFTVQFQKNKTPKEETKNKIEKTKKQKTNSPLSFLTKFLTKLSLSLSLKKKEQGMSSTSQMNIQHVPNESENFYDQIQMMLLYTLVVGFMNFICYLLTSKKKTVHERLYLGKIFFFF